MAKEFYSPAHTTRVQFVVERGKDEYILEPAIIWCVPLLDPARWEAIIRTLWGTRMITLTLRLSLVIIIHTDSEN